MDPTVAVRTKVNIIPSILNDVLRPIGEFVPLLSCNGFFNHYRCFHGVFSTWVIGLFSGTAAVPAEAFNVARTAVIFATMFVVLLGVTFHH